MKCKEAGYYLKNKLRCALWEVIYIISVLAGEHNFLAYPFCKPIFSYKSCTIFNNIISSAPYKSCKNHIKL